MEAGLSLILGKYERRQIVASGGFGTVLLCWDPSLAREVAIKQVRLDSLSEVDREEVLARFRQEARLVGKLSHPGIVGVYEYDERDGQASLVMEFVPGRTLAAFIREAAARGQPCHPDHAAALLTQTLHALAHCHRHGIVHRDIKPANILLTEDGVPKLTDFGVARTADSNLTVAGAMIGTPAYMSPEQYEGHNPADERSDLYACGVLLFELVTGVRPFEGDISTIMARILTQPPPRPSELVKTLPPALDEVVLRAMAKRPEDRFASAAEFIAALAAALPEAATVRQAAPPAPISHRPNRFLKVAAGVTALMVVGVAAYGLWPHPSVPVLDRLADVPCSVFHAEWQENPPTLTLGGMVGSGAAKQALESILAGVQGSVLRDRLQTVPASADFCGAIGLVRSIVGATGLRAPGALLLSVGGKRSPLIVNDKIYVSVTMANFDGLLQLDYFSGATVTSAESRDGRPVHVAANANWSGPAGDGIIGTVDEAGIDLVVAIASARPLSAPARPDEAPTEATLARLRAAVADARDHGTSMSADIAAVESAKQ